MIRALRLTSIAGIEIYLDWSLLIVFVLVMTSLGGGLLPSWHPDWGALAVWGTAACAAVLLLVSVLLHELSHALVGRAQGVDIRRITLFVFGGMAHLEREPHAWRAELLMAVVGPVVSIAIGMLCIFVAGLAGARELEAAAGAEAAFRGLGPGATLLLWLGPVNLVLGAFNLVPAFPLDGGRVLRAALWGVTGNLTRATRFAAAAGQAFSWVLIGAGVMMALGVTLPWLGGGLVSGLWLALIGWFLHNAAIASFRQVQLRESLRDVRVADLMKTRFATVAPDLPVEAFVEDYLMASEQRCYPVVAAGRLEGLVCLHDVRRLDRSARRDARVRDIMTPAERLATAAPESPAADALARFGNGGGVNQLPVVERGELRGILSREDVLKWLSFYGADVGDTRGSAGGPMRRA